MNVYTPKTFLGSIIHVPRNIVLIFLGPTKVQYQNFFLKEKNLFTNIEMEIIHQSSQMHNAMLLGAKRKCFWPSS